MAFFTARNARGFLKKRGITKNGVTVSVKYDSHIVIETKKVLNDMADVAVKKKRRSMKSGIDESGFKMPTRSKRQQSRLKKKGVPLNQYMKLSGKFMRSYKKYKPRISRRNIAYSSIQIGVPASKYWQSRGLVARGYFWIALTDASKFAVLRSLKGSKPFKERAFAPRKLKATR